MVTKERINQYKVWFDNLSFFGNNSFVFDEIENLWNLINYISNKYEKFCYVHIDKKTSYTKLDEKECIKLAQNFFDNHHINLNINELIQNGTIILKKKDSEKTDDFYYSTLDGSSYYDENNNRKLVVVMEGTIFDCAILIHEIMHYRNQPNGKRNFVNDLITESLSYVMELIFFEDLLDSVYNTDRSLHFRLFEKLMYIYAYRIYYIYKIILLYKREDDISKEKYDKIFIDGKYEQALEKFEEYVSKKRSVLRDTWMIIGLPLAIYMLDEYKKNKNFFELIEQMNIDINEKSIEECLSIININSREELINKIKNSTNSFIELLDKLYLTENDKNLFRKNLNKK